MIGLEAPVAVICHDAGAANHIFAWIEAMPDMAIRPFMTGPAAELWNHKFPNCPLAASMDSALLHARSVLTGTGWASNIEHAGVEAAKVRGLPCAAVVDHWVNYRSRFERDGRLALPDEIWVVDKWALDLAQATFPNIPIILQPNIYVAGIVDRIVKAPAGSDILYIAEPVRENWGRDEPGEFQAFEAFMARLGRLGIPSDTSLRLRPHPSEANSKYDAILQCYPHARRDEVPDLAASIAGARWVAGLESFALTIALIAGRTVISTLPKWAPQCRLPHEGIVHLRDVA